MRILQILAIISLLIAAIPVLALLTTGHSFGSRPAAVEQPVASDVQFIEANGQRFGYVEKGSGPLVLMFHGYPETYRSWSAVQKQLSVAGFRAIAVAMRGYAPSSLADDYSIRSLGKDVVALIAAFGAEKAIIIGHDWGASAVYEAAYIAPGRVSQLVALSIPHPKGIVPDVEFLKAVPHFFYYQLPTAPRLVWSKNFAHIDRIYKKWAPGYINNQQAVADVVESFKGEGRIEAALGYYRALVANGEDNSEIGPDKTIKVPTLVIAGADERGMTAERFKAAEAAFINHYQFHELPGIGHFPQLEAPEEVAKLILNVIQPTAR